MMQSKSFLFFKNVKKQTRPGSFPSGSRRDLVRQAIGAIAEREMNRRIDVGGHLSEAAVAERHGKAAKVWSAKIRVVAQRAGMVELRRHLRGADRIRIVANAPTLVIVCLEDAIVAFKV